MPLRIKQKYGRDGKLNAGNASLRRFYVSPEKAHSDPLEITGSEARHIFRVLRLSKGDSVELFDGTGTFYRARILSFSNDRVQLNIVGSFKGRTESPVQITLAQGFLKERKMEKLIRPLTELGIFCWMPFYATRSVPTMKENRLQKKRTRWEAIALESVKQCKRGQILRIETAASFSEVMKASKKTELRLLFYEEKAKGFETPVSPSAKPDSIMVVIGPEGGFSVEEVQEARANGFFTVGLGPRILRAQTAAVVACTLVQYLYGDMGKQ